ncbi:MAG: hypothetical protein COS94_06975 [Candidatus Hydrogenedentes bacterium CG07_land_8_20_14_0_80_42_17]|nr:MAG: hypothetical protein COS94_06975 [Candidatus Hydrogenedentes bacterium CG07_land_8_20_14_0_80_42_17]
MKEESKKLSAVVISENEEDVIEACLNSLCFCDEIILVDGGSKDRTIEIASRNSIVRIINHSSSEGGIHFNKNLGAKEAKGEWILSIDADEVVNSKLAGEILNTIERAEFHAYYLKRKTFFLGKWIRHCGWWPGKVIRLWKKGHAEWPLEVHLTPSAKEPCGLLEESLEHYSYRSVNDWIRKATHFSGCEAVEFKQKKELPNNLKLCYEITLLPALTFIKKLLFQSAWRDGIHGIVIAGSAAFAVWLRGVKKWEMKITGNVPNLGGRKGSL